MQDGSRLYSGPGASGLVDDDSLQSPLRTGHSPREALPSSFERYFNLSN